MNSIELGIQALTGGITGYVTNTTAVKMIFKKVLGFGGIILETREEFIENVSQLVEREIINHKTLQGELSKEEFNQVITRILNDFLQKELYNETHDSRVGQIPHMNQSLNNLLGFFSEKKGGVICDVFEVLSEKVCLRDILSDAQLKVLIEHGIDLSIEILRDSEILDQFIVMLYRKHYDDTLEDIIPPSMLRVVTANLNKLTGNLHGELEQDFDPAIEHLMEELYDALDIRLLMEMLEKSIKDKTIIELLGHTNAENISNELLKHMNEFLKSPEGKLLLVQLAEYIFTILKETRMPLFKLFQPQLAEDISSFLASKLPGLVNQLIGWLKRNQGQIEDKLEKALQTVLEQEAGLAAWVKRFLYEYMASKAFVHKFQIVGKMIKGIQDNVDVNVLSNDIASDLMDYLKNTNISEMVCSLETRGIFTSDDITQLLENNIDKLVTQVNLRAFDSYFNRKLGDFLQQPLAEPLEAYFKALMTKFKQEYVYTPKLSKTLEKPLKQLVTTASKQNLGNLFSDIDTVQSKSQAEDKGKDSFEKHITQITQIKKLSISELKKAIVSLGDKRRDDLVQIAVLQSQKWLAAKKLSDILDMTKEKQYGVIVTRKISSKVDFYLKEQIEKFQHKSIYSLYDRVNALPNIGEKLANGGIHLLHTNLEVMTKGQISAIVANNLSKLQNQQLQTVVEDFMGKELKPISWLGGFLGTLAGLGFGLAKSSFHITGSVSMVLSVPIYAMVGYLTNKQALWMIFHPYKPWRIAGKVMPLTQGVIVKSKPRFAKSMGHFVGKELLDPDSSVKLFKANRNSLAEVLTQAISVDNYQRIEKFLLATTPLITSGLMKTGTLFVEKNGDRWSQTAVETLGNMSFKEVDLKDLEKIIQIQGLDLPNKLQPYLVEFVTAGLQSERSLYDVMPHGVIELARTGMKHFLHQQLNQVQEILRNERLFEHQVVTMLDKPFTALIAKNLQELMSEQQKDEMKKKVATLITEQLRLASNQKKAQEMIQTKIVKELDPDKRLEDLFGGSLLKVIEKQVDPILAFLTEKAITVLDQERENLKRIAKDEAQKASGYELANALLNIDKTIEHVVDQIVNETAPDIIRGGREDLNAFILDSLQSLGKSQVGEMGIKITEQGVAEVVKNFMENPSLNQHLGILSSGMIEALVMIPLERMLAVTGIKNIADVQDFLGLELELARTHVTGKLEENEEKIILDMSDVALKVVEHLATEISMSSVFEGFGKGDVQQLLDGILLRITESKAYHCAVREFVEVLVKDVQTKELKSIMDSAVLKHDLSHIIDLLLKNEEIMDKVTEIFAVVLEDLFRSFNDIFEKETKDDITLIVVESMLNALENQIADLVQTLDLSNITEREITKMQPSEIEELFNSFARRYFRKLEYYGLWGGLLGFLMDIMIRL